MAWKKILIEGDTVPPSAHHTSHENGGADEISVAGLSGLLADDQNPTPHAADHKDGGGDEILLHELGEPTGAVDFAKQQATSLALDNQAEAPAAPVSGQIYFNTADKHPYVYQPA